MESLEEWCSKLAAEDAAVLVEGKKDREALQRNGVKNIVTVSNTSPYKLAEQLTAAGWHTAIILTDCDPEGRALYAKVKQALQRQGIRIIEKYRTFLLKNHAPTVIESIPQF